MKIIISKKCKRDLSKKKEGSIEGSVLEREARVAVLE